MKISKIYFGPGSPKKRFLRIFRNFFTKKWAGNLGITSETIWESRVKRPGNLEWKDLESLVRRPGIASETTWNPVLRGQCWLLAARLALALGWPCYVESWWDPRYVESFWIPSRFPGRFTRDSQVVSLVIPRFPAHSFVKKFRKNRKNQFFGFPGPK